jgi:MoaA/NifB/PqqE/SkfB family radical SAM enzyme
MLPSHAADPHPAGALPAPPVSPEYAPERQLRVSVELTNICNFTCPFCPQAFKHAESTPLGAPYNRRQGLMSRATFERAIAECNRVAETVELGFFGEQTLHRDYIELVRSLRERRFRLEISTNVSYVTREMMQAWIDARVDLLRFSLDAVTPEVFNRARPGKVKDLAGRIVSDGERMKAVNDKVRYWLALPEHRPTRLVYVKSSHNQGDERERFLAHWTPCLGPDDRILMKRVLTYGGKTADPLVLAHRCNVWDVRYLMIDWRGVVSPCNLDTNMDLALGNVLQDSIDALYHSPVANDLRRRTGCLKDLTPCRTCVDGNNWSNNETFANPLYESVGASR